MIKDYIAKMDPWKLIGILEEKGDFYKVGDGEDYKTYQYIRWGETLRLIVPVLDPELNAYHLASALEAINCIRNTPRDFVILRCLSENDIFSCIEKIRGRVLEIKEKSDAGSLADADVQELFTLCGELQEIQYVCKERGFEKLLENAGNRLKTAEYAADMATEKHHS